MLSLSDQWALAISGGALLIAYLCLCVIRDGLSR